MRRHENRKKIKIHEHRATKNKKKEREKRSVRSEMVRGQREQ